MSYTNETTHYGIPLPLGTDLTTPMDYNTSMQALDTAVFGAVTDASAGVEKANAVEESLGTTNDNLSALTGRVTSAEGTITTQGNAITQLQLDVADVKADALDMICAVDEGTAQVASVAVNTGEYFRYNDVLYMATDDIAIGDTIVPNTNCRATNVATELETLNATQPESFTETIPAIGTLQSGASSTNVVVVPLPNANDYTINVTNVNIRGTGDYTGNLTVNRYKNVFTVVLSTPTIASYGNYTVTYTAAKN